MKYNNAISYILAFSTLAFIQSTNAGILNYHRNFGLACAEPKYQPALDVRINSVALADAIRDMSAAILDLTRAEEHWSLSMLQGLTSDGEQQRYNMLLASNKAFASSIEASNRLNNVTISQKKIMSDAAANKLPGRGSEIFGAMSKTIAGATAKDFEDSVNKQLDDYASKISEVRDSLNKTNQTISEGYGNASTILSPEHTALSNQIRQSTELTLQLLTFAEQTSAQTVKEVRDTAAAVKLTACGTEQKQ